MKKCSLCGYEAEEMSCMNCEEPMEEKCDACGDTPGNCNCPRQKKGIR